MAHGDEEPTALPTSSGLPTKSDTGDSDYRLFDVEEKDARNNVPLANSEAYNPFSPTPSGLASELETGYDDEELEELEARIKEAEKDIEELGYTSLEPEWETDSLRSESSMYSHFFEEVDVEDEKDHLEKHLQEREAYWNEKVKQMEGVEKGLSKKIAERHKKSFLFRALSYFRMQWLTKKWQDDSLQDDLYGLSKRAEDAKKDMMYLESYFEKQRFLRESPAFSQDAIEYTIKAAENSLAESNEKLQNEKSIDQETLKREAVEELTKEIKRINKSSEFVEERKPILPLHEGQVEDIKSVKKLLHKRQNQAKKRLEKITSKRERSFFFYISLYFEKKRVEEQKQKIDEQLGRVEKIIEATDMEALKSYREKRIKALKSVTTKDLIEADNTLDIEKCKDLLTKEGMVDNDKIIRTTNNIRNVLNNEKYVSRKTKKSLSNSEVLEIYEMLLYHKERVKFWEKNIKNFELQIRLAKLELQRMQATTAVIVENGELPTHEEETAQMNKAEHVNELELLSFYMKNRLNHHKKHIKDIIGMKDMILKFLKEVNPYIHCNGVYKEVISGAGELKKVEVDESVEAMEKNLTDENNIESLKKLQPIATASLLLDIIKQGDEEPQHNEGVNNKEGDEKSQRNEKVESKKALLERIKSLEKKAIDLRNANSQNAEEKLQKKESQGMLVKFKKFIQKRRGSGEQDCTTKSSNNTSKGVKAPTRIFKVFGKSR